MPQIKCRHCDVKFKGVPSHRYCSLACRLWANVDKGAHDECWEWASGTTDDYGRIRFYGEHLKAHRVSYELANGPIPAGLHVCHACDNPKCCNPAHLWLGTHIENMADRDEKGRNKIRLGKDHHSCRFGEADIYEIRWQRDRKLLSQRALAKAYSVDKSTIQAIEKRDTWKHLPEVERI